MNVFSILSEPYFVVFMQLLIIRYWLSNDMKIIDLR